MKKASQQKHWVVYSGIFIIALGGLYSQLIWNNSRQERSLFHADLYNQAAMGAALSKVHDYSGHTFYTLEDLQKSSYYPFKQSYLTCHGGQVYIYFNFPPKGLTVDGYIGLKSLKIDEDLNLHTMRPFSYANNLSALSYQAMQAYCAGVQERIKQINTIRAAFLVEHKHAEAMCPTSHQWTIKPIPQPSIAGNMPKTRVELQKYVAWLKQTEGVKQLQDGWHQPLVFSLEDQQLVCVSPGPDGVLHSADDIVVRSSG